jgi:hypothetical protein
MLEPFGRSEPTRHFFSIEQCRQLARDSAGG